MGLSRVGGVVGCDNSKTSKTTLNFKRHNFPIDFHDETMMNNPHERQALNTSIFVASTKGSC